MYQDSLFLRISPGSNGSPRTFNAPGATFAYGISFVAVANRVQSLIIPIRSINGTGGSYRVRLQADAVGNIPSGTDLATKDISAIPTAAGLFVMQLDLDVELTIGGQYWLIVENIDLTPASNYIVTEATYSSGVYPCASLSRTRSWNGINWTTVGSTGEFGMAITFHDGQMLGIPISRYLQMGVVSNSSSKKIGIRFDFALAKSSVDIDAVTFDSVQNLHANMVDVYINNSLIKSVPLLKENISSIITAHTISSCYPKIAVQPGDVVRMMITNPNNVSNLNFSVSACYFADSASAAFVKNKIPLKPNACTMEGGVFTDIDKIPPFSVLLSMRDLQLNRRKFSNAR